MRIVFIAALAIGVTSCVSDKMNKGLGFVVGQNIGYAVQRLGYPDAKREMLGDTIYVWGSSQNVALPMTTTSTTTGMVGGVPVYGTTTGTGYMRANFNCTIQMAVGANNIIKSWQWNGNMGGCEQYARRLSH